MFDRKIFLGLSVRNFLIGELFLEFVISSLDGGGGGVVGSGKGCGEIV